MRQRGPDTCVRPKRLRRAADPMIPTRCMNPTYLQQLENAQLLTPLSRVAGNAGKSAEQLTAGNIIAVIQKPATAAGSHKCALRV